MELMALLITHYGLGWSFPWWVWGYAILMSLVHVRINRNIAFKGEGKLKQLLLQKAKEKEGK